MFSGLPCETHKAHLAHVARDPGEIGAYSSYSMELGGDSVGWRVR